ncbi:glycosyltransferase family 4 protein [Halomicrococcus sp. SG-WS-1]|uniref:glycosyltransferase family 4 protein n=1 Tax=Halomicrococcus sp. SG-WS-1 TaxID=3439057 RepID=UPI003F79204D
MLVHGDRTTPPDDSIELCHLGETPASIGEFLSLYRTIHSRTNELEYDIFHPLEEYPWPTKIRTVQWTMDSWERWKLCPSDFQGYTFMGGEALINAAGAVGGYFTDDVIASSPETSQQMEKYWLQSPTDVIPLGIEESELEPPERVDDTVRVLLPGRITPKKGQKRVLDRLSQNAGYSVDIVGGVSDEQYYETLSEWHEHHHGFVSRERLNEFYRESDIVLVPSYHENFSMVALEAIAKGCVVIITQVCGFAKLDVATPENGIYVVSGGQEMADRVEILAKSSDIFDRQVAAFELAQQLTWERIASQYEESYQKIA